MMRGVHGPSRLLEVFCFLTWVAVTHTHFIMVLETVYVLCMYINS